MDTLNTDRSGPQLSVVLVTPHRYANISKVVKHLQAQTVLDQLEIIIVAPERANLEVPASDKAAFSRIRVVKVPEIKSTGRAIYAGFHEATAPLVAYAEEHAYPTPGWAEALIKAHSQPWAAVGVALANANPVNMISWASLYTDFGPWVEPVDAGEIQHLPWHHAAYKRAVLREYGPKLEAVLETESILHEDLRLRGHRFYLEPAAKTNHVNISLLSSYIAAEFNGARMFTGNRALTTSTLWRLIYMCRTPLMPFVRLRRVVRHIIRSGRARELLPGILPALSVGLIADALGQLIGYAFGVGNAAQRRVSFELNRCQHVTEHERANHGE